MNTPLRIFYVRHGQTAWSLSGQHTGRSDIPLTAAGEHGAEALRPWLAGVRFAQVLTSPMARAQRTCTLAGLGAQAHIENDLREWDYGDYEGLTSAEILSDRPDWDLFRDGCPNGEAPQTVAARVDALIERLALAGGDVALFSHGHFGAALVARWIEAPLEAGRRFFLGAPSLSVLATHPHHPDVRGVDLWNAAPERLSGASGL